MSIDLLFDTEDDSSIVYVSPVEYGTYVQAKLIELSDFEYDLMQTTLNTPQDPDDPNSPIYDII